MQTIIGYRRPRPQGTPHALRQNVQRRIAADIEGQDPQHVVYRSFPSETVVLNLQTGQYHGLNATAGSMLEALKRTSCVRDAAVAVATEYAQPQAVVEQDMCELCNALLARGLIERA
jgi:Coenzyme PQQ synthesis protein D (PqqD)